MSYVDLPSETAFLSTLPARGATPGGHGGHTDPVAFLSTLPARGATCPTPRPAGCSLFLSTLPARGATQDHPRPDPPAKISIHAPREGSDCRARRFRTGASRHFYPRSPRGERPWKRASASPPSPFLSTLPARGATKPPGRKFFNFSKFLSTLPARGATAKPNKNTAGFCAKGTNADLGCTKRESQFCAFSMIFLRAGAVRRGFAGANLPVGPCALGLRTGGGRRPDYTSSTSSWDHCGARPMCSTRVL